MSYKKTWWVKFDKFNGRIITVTQRQIKEFQDSEEVAQIDNTLCRDILKGRVNKNNYAIFWDYKTEEWKMDVKSTTLVLKPRDNKLLPIQLDRSPEYSDLYLRVFKKENIIMISVDLKNIAETMNLADINFISNDDSNLLDIYLTRKNDPDYLIDIIPVSAEQLIKNTRMIVELSEKTAKLIDWENTSIYTKPVFKNYAMEYVSGNVESTVDKSSKTLKQAQPTTEGSDINIYIDNDKLCFNSALSENQLYYFGSKPKFNLTVSDGEIDRFVGVLELSTIKLCSNQTYTIKKPSNWPQNPVLAYKNKHVTISYTGEKNVSEH